ncbi:MAG: holo-ACP synthase [Candidatus Aminicenantales bacterium]
MIIGIGIDVIEVARVKKAVEKNPRFLGRVFTADEIRYAQTKKNKFQHLAARFAAKEAFFKALGRRIGWADVAITNQASGKPDLIIHTQEEFSDITRCHVSLSHLKEYALAIVLLEKE